MSHEHTQESQYQALRKNSRASLSDRTRQTELLSLRCRGGY
jgi:hypothetical protein